MLVHTKYFQIANLLDLYLIIIKLKNINNIAVKMQRRFILRYNIIIHNFPTHKHTKYIRYLKIFKILTISVIEHNDICIFYSI